jgi:hypothetical protein
MVTARRYPIVCQCGHKGEVLWVDKGTPANICEEYSLDGFEGKHIIITRASDFPEDIVDELQPKCPDCGATGKVRRV